MKNGNPKERLKIFAKSVKLGQTAFEEKIGLSRGAISKMKETSTITGKVIEKIIKNYPDANSTWLLTGEGEMLKTKLVERSKEYNQKTTESRIAESDLPVSNEGFKEKYYILLEKYVALTDSVYNVQLARLTELPELLKKIQKDLDDVLGNQITMSSMGQAMQDVLVEVLSPEHHGDLRRSVHNKGVAIQRVLKNKGNRIKIDT